MRRDTKERIMPKAVHQRRKMGTQQKAISNGLQIELIRTNHIFMCGYILPGTFFYWPSDFFYSLSTSVTYISGNKTYI